LEELEYQRQYGNPDSRPQTNHSTTSSVGYNESTSYESNPHSEYSKYDRMPAKGTGKYNFKDMDKLGPKSKPVIKDSPTKQRTPPANSKSSGNSSKKSSKESKSTSGSKNRNPEKPEKPKSILKPTYKLEEPKYESQPEQSQRQQEKPYQEERPTAPPPPPPEPPKPKSQKPKKAKDKKQEENEFKRRKLPTNERSGCEPSIYRCFGSIECRVVPTLYTL